MKRIVSLAVLVLAGFFLASAQEADETWPSGDDWPSDETWSAGDAWPSGIAGDEDSDAGILTADDADQGSEAGIAGQDGDTGITAGGAVSNRILNNDYYAQSLRLSGLARYSYESGDYDASETYSEEAIRYARLSDSYVAEHALGAAKARLDWAGRVNAETRFPQAYRAAQAAYQEAEENHSQELFGETVSAANRVFQALSVISGGAGPGAVPSGAVPQGVFPARYTVRGWDAARDCLWNIAAQPWAYGNPHEWRRIYNANRSSLPNPDDPDLLEPGMVLEIPSLRGETRQGTWSPSGRYPSMR